MIHGQIGDVVGRRDGLARHGANNQTSYEPWSAGGCDRIQFFKGDVGLPNSFVDNCFDLCEMRSGSDFWYDAAIKPVVIQLRVNDIGQDLPVRRYNGCGCLIAGGLYA